MKVSLSFFAAHKRTAGTDKASIELPEGSSARDAAHAAETQFGLVLKGSMVAINDEYAEPERKLEAGDTVAFIPPVAGGAAQVDAGGSSQDFFQIIPNALEIAELHTRLIAPGWGGQASFTGSTRTPNKGLAITRLEYEAYPELAQNVMRDLALEARAKWELGAIVLAHRTGIVLPGQISIFVGASSAHRSDCQQAVPWLVDEAKARLPVWKLEVAENGERWVDGSTRAPTL